METSGAAENMTPIPIGQKAGDAANPSGKGTSGGSRGGKAKIKNPSVFKTQIHHLGIISEGHILGLEEAVFSPGSDSLYGCTVTCVEEAEVFRIEKYSFVSKLSVQTQAWQLLHRKCINWMRRGSISVSNKASIPAKLKMSQREEEKRE